MDNKSDRSTVLNDVSNVSYNQGQILDNVTNDVNNTSKKSSSDFATNKEEELKRDLEKLSEQRKADELKNYYIKLDEQNKAAAIEAKRRADEQQKNDSLSYLNDFNDSKSRKNERIRIEDSRNRDYIKKYDNEVIDRKKRDAERLENTRKSESRDFARNRDEDLRRETYSSTMNTKSAERNRHAEAVFYRKKSEESPQRNDSHLKDLNDFTYNARKEETNKRETEKYSDEVLKRSSSVIDRQTRDENHIDNTQKHESRDYAHSRNEDLRSDTYTSASDTRTVKRNRQVKAALYRKKSEESSQKNDSYLGGLSDYTYRREETNKREVEKYSDEVLKRSSNVIDRQKRDEVHIDNTQKHESSDYVHSRDEDLRSDIYNSTSDVKTVQQNKYALNKKFRKKNEDSGSDESSLDLFTADGKVYSSDGKTYSSAKLYQISEISRKYKVHKTNSTGSKNENQHIQDDIAGQILGNEILGKLAMTAQRMPLSVGSLTGANARANRIMNKAKVSAGGKISKPGVFRTAGKSALGGVASFAEETTDLWNSLSSSDGDSDNLSSGLGSFVKNSVERGIYKRASDGHKISKVFNSLLKKKYMLDKLKNTRGDGSMSSGIGEVLQEKAVNKARQFAGGILKKIANGAAQLVKSLFSLLVKAIVSLFGLIISMSVPVLILCLPIFLAVIFGVVSIGSAFYSGEFSEYESNPSYCSNYLNDIYDEFDLEAVNWLRKEPIKIWVGPEEDDYEYIYYEVNYPNGQKDNYKEMLNLYLAIAEHDFDKKIIKGHEHLIIDTSEEISLFKKVFEMFNQHSVTGEYNHILNVTQYSFDEIKSKLSDEILEYYEQVVMWSEEGNVSGATRRSKIVSENAALSNATLGTTPKSYDELTSVFTWMGNGNAYPVGNGRVQINSPYTLNRVDLAEHNVHYGVDFGASTGDPLVALSDATVYMAGYSSSYGNHVILRFPDNTYALYAHMDSISVYNGQQVSTGQSIGAAGSTGDSTGPHLHLVLSTDPYGTAPGSRYDFNAYIKNVFAPGWNYSYYY